MGLRGKSGADRHVHIRAGSLIEALENRRLLSGGPAAPSGLGAKATSSGVLLTWTDHAKAKDTTVVVERAAGGKFHAVATLGGAATTFIDTSAQGGVVYAYRVHALRGGASSASTKPVTVTARKHAASTGGSVPSTGSSGSTGTPQTTAVGTPNSGGGSSTSSSGSLSTAGGSMTLSSGVVNFVSAPVSVTGGSTSVNGGGAVLTLTGPNTLTTGSLINSGVTTNPVGLTQFVGVGSTGFTTTTTTGITTSFATVSGGVLTMTAPVNVNSGLLIDSTLIKNGSGNGTVFTGNPVVTGGSTTTSPIVLTQGTLTLTGNVTLPFTTTPTIQITNPLARLNVIGVSGGNLVFSTAPAATVDLTGAVLKLATATSTVGVLKLATGALVELNVSPANLSAGATAYTFADGRTVGVVIDPNVSVAIDASPLHPGSYTITRTGVSQPLTVVVPATA